MSDWGMPSRSIWGLTPRQSIELECARRGEADVVACCIELLAGRDVDDELVFAIGGPAARSISTAGSSTGCGCGPCARCYTRGRTRPGPRC